MLLDVALKKSIATGGRKAIRKTSKWVKVNSKRNKRQPRGFHCSNVLFIYLLLFSVKDHTTGQH